MGQFWGRWSSETEGVGEQGGSKWVEESRGRPTLGWGWKAAHPKYFLLYLLYYINFILTLLT